MKNLLIILIILLLVTVSHLACAESFSSPQGAASSTSDWDHLGTAFAAQMIAYGITKTILKIGYHEECTYDYYYHECQYKNRGKIVYNRTESVIVSTIVTLGLTFAYSFLKAQASGNQTNGREILMNSIGQFTAIGTIYVFRF